MQLAKFVAADIIAAQAARDIAAFCAKQRGRDGLQCLQPEDLVLDLHDMRALIAAKPGWKLHDLRHGDVANVMASRCHAFVNIKCGTRSLSMHLLTFVDAR